MAQLTGDFDLQAAASPMFRRVAAFLVAGILLSGALFRVVEFANDRSLWLDEAALAQNVLHLPVGELALGRLTDDQVAPPGFLLVVKGISALAGSGEQMLRLLPFLAGLGALAFFGFLAWRRLGPVGAIAAAALMAWSWPLVYYSNEFKQYSTDALVAILLFALALNMEGRELTRRRAWLIGAAGAAALVFSQPAVFVLGAWGIVEKNEARRQRRREESARWNVLGAIWILFMGLELASSYPAALGNAKLTSYHADAFLRLWPLGEAAQVWWDGVLGSWILATSEATWWLWLALLLAGIWAGWQKHRRETALVVLAALFMALASLFRFYPLTLRLQLFLFPLLFWLVGRGAGWLAGQARGRAAPVVVAVLALAAWPLWRDGVAEARAPIAREHLRPVVAKLAEQARPGDVALVFDYTHYAFDYYWPRMTHPDVAVRNIIIMEDKALTPEQITAKVAPALADKPPRVWLVATHYEVGAGQDNLRALVAALRQRYPGAADFVAPGGTAQGVVFFEAGSPPVGPAK